MLKLINANLSRLGQSFIDELDDVDWGEDPRARKQDSPYLTKDTTPPIPHGQQGVIGDETFEDLEPGSAEEQGIEPYMEPDLYPEARDEIPIGNEMLGIPEGSQEIEYNDGKQLAYDGIDSNEVISFDYTNRFGIYAGTRTVEPHYTFVATETGNEVLVGYDRDQGDIRAFIVGNIHPFGVRYESVNFTPRGEIMRGIY